MAKLIEQYRKHLCYIDKKCYCSDPNSWDFELIVRDVKKNQTNTVVEFENPPSFHRFQNEPQFENKD